MSKKKQFTNNAMAKQLSKATGIKLKQHCVVTERIGKDLDIRDADTITKEMALVWGIARLNKQI